MLSASQHALLQQGVSVIIGDIRGPITMRVISNRVAFVTGGASGIGLGIVRRLLAHGVNVMAADLRADHLWGPAPLPNR